VGVGVWGASFWVDLVTCMCRDRCINLSTFAFHTISPFIYYIKMVLAFHLFLELKYGKRTFKDSWQGWEAVASLRGGNRTDRRFPPPPIIWKKI